MTLYLISLGLFSKDDISLKAIKYAKKCKKLYIERYTNFYNSSNNELSKVFNKKIIDLSREEVESNRLIKEAKKEDIALLVCGDSLTATTHMGLIIDAKKENINFKVVHGSSIFTAIALTGLMLYRFGKTTSIPFDNKDIESPYNVLKDNKDSHTLFLLDLKGNKYMDVNEAIEYLLRIEKEKDKKVFTKDTICLGCVALGSGKEIIKAGRAKDLLKFKFKGKPQCLIVPGKLHFTEEEALELWN